MSKNTSVNLGDHFSSYIGTQVKQGRYGSTSEVIRATLRLFENQDAKLNALRNKLEASENQAERGEFADYSLEKLTNELDQENVS